MTTVDAADGVVARDPTSGWVIPVPPGWHVVPESPFAVVCVDHEFAPSAGTAATLVGAVWPRASDTRLDAIVIESCRTWASATPSAQVVQVDDISERAGVEAIVMTGVYSTGLMSHILVTVFALTPVAVARLDLTVPAEQSRRVDLLLDHILAAMVWPTRAPAFGPDPEAARQFVVATVVDQRGAS